MIEKSISDFKIASPEVVEDIRHWIINVLDAKYPELNNLKVCPFARSIIDDVIIVELPYPELFTIKEDFEMIIFVSDLPWRILSKYVEKLRETYPEGMWFVDHKDTPTYVKGVQTNHPNRSFIAVQPKNKVTGSRDSMRKAKWYDLWSAEEWATLVKARHVTDDTDF